MADKIMSMIIDENEQWKLKKYGRKITKTDHNTIILELKVEKNPCEKTKKPVRYNVKNEESRRNFCRNIEDDQSFDTLFTDRDIDLEGELHMFMKKWDGVIQKSFTEVKPSKHRIPGVDPEVKELLKRETWIRRNVVDNVEKGRSISEIQKLITGKIADNLTTKLEAQVEDIVKSDNPHSKVFQVRRRTKKNLNIDFPLKDANGVLQVSRIGINRVIKDHFQKVFAQNDIPKQQIWQDYWKVIDQTFHEIDLLLSLIHI